MNYFGFFLIAVSLLLTGCQKKNPAIAPLEEITSQPFYPTAAQPKLPTIKLWIGAEEMETEMALTEMQVRTGMMFRTNLAENAGMIFVFPGPHRASFWMKNCSVPLSAAYIDPDGRVLEIVELEPHNTNSVAAASDDVQYVIEANRGWFEKKNITPGALVRSERGTLRKTFFRTE